MKKLICLLVSVAIVMSMVIALPVMASGTTVNAYKTYTNSPDCWLGNGGALSTTVMFNATGSFAAIAFPTLWASKTADRAAATTTFALTDKAGNTVATKTEVIDGDQTSGYTVDLGTTVPAGQYTLTISILEEAKQYIVFSKVTESDYGADTVLFSSDSFAFGLVFMDDNAGFAKLDLGDDVIAVTINAYNNYTYSPDCWIGNGNAATKSVKFNATGAFTGVVFPILWASAGSSAANATFAILGNSDTAIATKTVTIDGDKNNGFTVDFDSEIPAGTYTLTVSVADASATYVVLSQIKDASLDDSYLTFSDETFAFGVKFVDSTTAGFAAVGADEEPAPNTDFDYVGYEEYGKGVHVSFDTLYVDGEMVANGTVPTWVEENLTDRTFDTDSVSKIGIRGWAAFDQAITAFGYIENGALTLDASFATERADVVAAGFANGVGFEIDIPVAATSGTIVAVAQLADGTIVALNGGQSTAFTLSSATNPAPATADSSMVVFMIAAAAFVATVVLAKKKEF